MLKRTQFCQVDGEALIYDTENDEVSNSFVSEMEELSESEVELFQCDICDFSTENKKGLAIHISKVQKKKCDECGMRFECKDKLERHMKAKKLYSVIDPKSSPDKEMKLDFLQNDETCLVVYGPLGLRRFLVLHSSECWSRVNQSCYCLPPETSEKDSVLKDVILPLYTQ